MTIFKNKNKKKYIYIINYNVIRFLEFKNVYNLRMSIFTKRYILLINNLHYLYNITF